LLLANPTDAYRLLNLTATTDVSALSGVSGLGAHSALGPQILLAALAAWIAAPLLGAMVLFARRPV
jgi:Cu-processing system permease protein